MCYSKDLRERVLRYIANGVSKKEASRLFGVHRQTIYNWLSLDDLSVRRYGPRIRKLDKEALRIHVRDYPDALLRERALHFGVHINAIWVALKQLEITKKNHEVL